MHSSEIPALTGMAQWAGCHSPKPKGCQFNSWSGHMAWVAGQVPCWAMQEASDQCFSRTLMFLSLSLSLPLSLKTDKIF